MTVERKFLGGKIEETKQSVRNGVTVGIVEGHIAAFSPDQGSDFFMPDRFLRGAFLDSIEIHKQRQMRPVRLNNQHRNTIGGFPIETVGEDSIGLFGIGEVNIDIQEGAEAFSMAKAGFITDLSIGFSSDVSEVVNGIREIAKATIWEGSLVSEPMNQDARITVVKSAVFSNLDVKDVAVPEADETDDPRAYLDEAKTIRIGSAIGGKMYACGESIKQVMDDMLTGEIEQTPELVRHLERYLAKMNVKSPFKERYFFDISAVKKFDKKALERALVTCGAFSRDASKYLLGRFNAPVKANDAVGGDSVMADLRSMIATVRSQGQ